MRCFSIGSDVAQKNQGCSGLLNSVFVTEDLSPSEAEVAFGIGLSVWGISDAKAKKLISRPLEFGPVE